MPEWWTYSLSDFLLFSPRTYYRLIERHNLAIWPAHLFTLALGVTIAVLLRRSTPARSRAIAVILAALWAWVGWAFVAARYATINWAAVWLACLFAVEVPLLGWLGAATEHLRFGWKPNARYRFGAGLFAVVMGFYPLLAPALGRGWTQAELFGIAPDPTVLGTMGVLLMTEGSPRARWAALAPPVIWCLLSGVTLLAMGSAEAWIVLVAGSLTMLLAALAGPKTASAAGHSE
jgi:Family of unknown function (DUF6064)